MQCYRGCTTIRKVEALGGSDFAHFHTVDCGGAVGFAEEAARLSRNAKKAPAAAGAGVEGRSSL